MLRNVTPERLNALADGVFAVLITILVLELRAPEQTTFDALLALWHSWVSYALSYLFIAVVWVNHHFLLGHVRTVTPRLIWFNFACLFSISFLPFSTAWMAASHLAPQPVAFYAAASFLVNATYAALIHELIARDEIAVPFRKIMRIRAFVTLGLFAVAAIVALKSPLACLGICFCCFVVYLNPEPPGAGKRH